LASFGNRNAPECDDYDVRKIIKALSDEVEALNIRMKMSESPENVDFKLQSDE